MDVDKRVCRRASSEDGAFRLMLDGALERILLFTFSTDVDAVVPFPGQVGRREARRLAAVSPAWLRVVRGIERRVRDRVLVVSIGPETVKEAARAAEQRKVEVLCIREDEGREHPVDWKQVFSFLPDLLRLDLSFVPLKSAHLITILEEASTQCPSVIALILPGCTDEPQNVGDEEEEEAKDSNEDEDIGQSEDHAGDEDDNEVTEEEANEGDDFGHYDDESMNDTDAELHVEDEDNVEEEDNADDEVYEPAIMEWASTMDMWKSFCSTCTDLREFSWIVVPFTDEYMIPFGATPKPMLRRLQIEFSSANLFRIRDDEYSQQGLLTMLSGVPCLEVLEIEFQQNLRYQIDAQKLLTDDFLETIVAICPRLRRLSIGDTMFSEPIESLEHITDRGLQSLAKSSLEEIDCRIPLLSCSASGKISLLTTTMPFNSKSTKRSVYLTGADGRHDATDLIKALLQPHHLKEIVHREFVLEILAQETVRAASIKALQQQLERETGDHVRIICRGTAQEDGQFELASLLVYTPRVAVQEEMNGRERVLRRSVLELVRDPRKHGVIGELCAAVLARIDAIALQLVEKGIDNAHRDGPFIQAEHASLVASFQRIVERYMHKPRILQLGTVATFCERVRLIHERIDWMMQVIGIPVKECAAASRTWRRDYYRQRTAALELVRNSTMDIRHVQQDIRRVRDAFEVLTVLEHERQKWSGEPVSQTLEALCEIVIRQQSVVELPRSVPVWTMAEDVARSRQYAYVTNSNLVLEADRETRRRRDEPTGEVESLAGRITYRMGDLAQKATAPVDASRKRRSGKGNDDAEERLKKRIKQLSRGVVGDAGDDMGDAESRRKGLLFTTGGLAATRTNILSESLALESATYRPTNPQSQDAYEQMMSVVARYLGDQPGEILAGTAEEVLSILKNDTYRDDEKHSEVKKLLKGLESDVFSQLVVFGKRITDFVADGQATSGAAGAGDLDQEDGDGDGELDKEMGVAVVFDEEEDEEESDLDEVRDEDDEDEDDDDDHEVDYDKFEFIKLLLENRAKVLYCTRIKQAQSDEERKSIEAEMLADESLNGEGESILKQLNSTASAESWMQDRIGAMESTSRAEASKLRKQQVKRKEDQGRVQVSADDDDVEEKRDDNEDVDMEDVTDSAREKAKPQRYIDLSSLAFHEGGHLKTNKECHLPDGILKRIEKKDILWDKYMDLEPSDLGQLINNPQYGKQLYKYIHQFPRLELSVHVQPITRAMLKVVEEDEEEHLSALNLGMIAAYYYIQYTTVELFARHLAAQAKLKSLLTILASATEFSELPSRFGEEERLESIAKHLKYPVLTANGDYSQPHVKANVLLQVHFSKEHDKLSPLLPAMDLAQMVVQAQWNSDSPLMQIPFFTKDILNKLQTMKLDDDVETPLDILSMDDDARKELLPFPNSKMSAVAKFCNAYPDVNVQTKVVNDGKNLPAGSTASIKVLLEREGDDDEEDEDEDVDAALGLVQASHYPVKKAENWWIVLGDSSKNSLLGIKRVPFASKKINVQVDFTAPEQVGEYNLQLYVICDGYAGCDLENEVTIDVVEGGADTSDDDDDDDEEE
ncbi:hypothetical protein P43SY_000331 [Pythium insidiosum]|uniref:SEC63 domain-containing protein n=1 Tax=Pythium insidiosum TaxID=114742 RepID=A0AAD5LAU7_PYTIN|nr:hypothetical protein P43SY_000331 [Pythium insidiosum]